jgi:uncharacterized FlgJ-related protein
MRRRMKKVCLIFALFFVSFLPNGGLESQVITNTQVTYENLYQEITSMGIKFPEIVFAQAVLETGHFNSELFHTANNLFGMKVPKKRKTLSISEEKRGFAVFEDWTFSVKDYLLWQEYVMRNKKIENSSQYLKLLDKIYAKNKNYSKSLLKIMGNFNYIFKN